jgi:hypothetical protein
MAKKDQGEVSAYVGRVSGRWRVLRRILPVVLAAAIVSSSCGDEPAPGNPVTDGLVARYENPIFLRGWDLGWGDCVRQLEYLYSLDTLYGWVINDWVSPVPPPSATAAGWTFEMYDLFTDGYFSGYEEAFLIGECPAY